MADPHLGMISFQRALRERLIDIHPVRNHNNLFSHLDEPEPGVPRFTYVRLLDDGVTVIAFASFVMNGFIGDSPCTAAGYAVPQAFRGRGYAKQILVDAIHDLTLQAGHNGFETVYFEAVINASNLASQRVAEFALAGAERDEIIDAASGVPACRYTVRYDTMGNKKPA